MSSFLYGHRLKENTFRDLPFALILIFSLCLSACASVGAAEEDEVFKPVERVVVSLDSAEPLVTHITTTVGVTPLIYKIVPADATNREVIWQKYDDTGTEADIYEEPLDEFDALAIIPENSAVAYLYTYGTGIVTVDAIVADGISGDNGQDTKDFIQRFYITVQPTVPVTNIALILDGTPNQGRGNVDGTVLTGIVEPSNATNQNIELSIVSGGQTNAKISENNTISSDTAGKVRIMATIKDGVAVGYDYAKEFTIPMEVYVTGLKLKQATVLMVGESETIAPTISPNTASNQGLIWKSNTPRVATVSNNGLVNAVAAGNAIITASTKDGNYVASCVVSVQPLRIGAQDRIEVTLNMNSMSLSLSGSKFNYLQASVSSSYTSNQDLIWTSSDDGIATVTHGTHEKMVRVEVHVLKGERATVTAVSPGTAVITVTTADGQYFATCNVTVNP